MAKKRSKKSEAATADASPPAPDTKPSAPSPPTAYTVVARRYRPQRFEDVVGQDHVVKALRNAIRLNRIAQAYLFCGTRGVGKTSMARIFAKCLNCVQGPTEQPCQTCDICQSIALGQDVDVIEIDGASNNGVEQVRELRQNAALRPSRARFKIYYIDEVHMLSTGAFNALLKTLEEPPAHVKFLFATTEANKIPITVLSRCQRYDFAGITPDVIAKTLSAICVQEHVEAEPEALQIVARRASGSLRDAQSLLDRLLASGSPKLTVEVVNALLGTASDERLLAMLEALADHNSAAALRLLEESAGSGIQPAEILSGIIDFTRDALVMAVGAESMLASVSPRQRPQLERIVERWTVDTILAASQIFAECRARMRGSLHGRLLVELALVRVARLEDLTQLATLVERLAALEAGTPGVRRPEGGVKPAIQALAETVSATALPAQPPGASFPHSSADRPVAPRSVLRDSAALPAVPAAAPSVVDDPRPSVPTALSVVPEVRETITDAGTEAVVMTATATLLEPESARSSPREESSALDLAAARKVWPDVVKKVGAGLGWRLSQVEPTALAGPDVLVIAAKPGYNAVADECGTADSLAKIAQAFQRLTHQSVTVKYESSSEDEGSAVDARSADARQADVLASDPMIQKIIELFEARSLVFEYEEPDPNASI